MRLGEMMIELGYLNEQKLDIALQEQAYNLKTINFSEPIGMILLRNGVITDEQLENALIAYFRNVETDPTTSDSDRMAAKVSLNSLEKAGPDGLSRETKLILVEKLEEYQEKIAQIQSSAMRDREKMVVVLKNKMEAIKGDLERFS